MFETAVGDGSKKLWLQKEVPKSGGVDAHVASFLVGISSRNSQIAFSSSTPISSWGSGGRCVIGLEFLVGIVDEVFFVRHDGVFSTRRFVILLVCGGERSNGRAQDSAQMSASLE